MSPCVPLGTDKSRIGTANLIREQCGFQCGIFEVPESHSQVPGPEIPPPESHSLLFLWFLLSEQSL